MVPEPLLADDAHIFFLGDEGVVFSQSRQELHVLNTSAAVIWCLMADGLSRANLEAELRARSGLSRAAAGEYVAAALAHWGANGLLAGSRGPERPDPPPGMRPQSGLPAYPETTPCFVVVQTYQLLGMTFQCRYANVARFALLHPMMAHLETAPAPEARCFDVVEADGTFLLYRDGEPLQACRSAGELAPILYAWVWMSATRSYPYWLNIHAGVVRGRDGCVLMPGVPGSGKSTLSLALVRAGYEFFSDEVALLEPGTMRVVPFPQAICLKESGLGAAMALFPDIAGLASHMRGDGKRVAYFAPPRARLPPADAKADVRVLLFPRYRPGEGARCVPLSHAAALGRLLEQCTVIEGGLDVASVAGLVRWMAALECWELTYGTTADAVAAVAGLLPPRG